MNVILWLILVALISGYLCHAHPCLTWELHQKELKLVFKTNDFATNVSFLDNNGTERGFCDFNTSCHNILYEKEERQVVLKLVNLSDINGIWSCQQGFDNFSTHVISTGDISKSTHLKMKGSVLQRQNKTFVQVECSSCREPYRNQVHYLLNKRFGDIVSYQSNSNICTNNNGECKGSICSCSPFGNLFTRAFERDGDSTMTFSCAMKFSWAWQDFVKVSHLVYDGKDGFTFTEIQDSSPTTDVTPIVTTVSSITNGMDIWGHLGIVLAVLIVILVIILFSCYLLKKRRKDNGVKNEEETFHLLTEKTDSNEAINDDLKRWIVIKICLHGIASERLCVYVRSFLEILFNFWEEKVHIKTQSFKCRVITYQHKIKLNYTAINSNAEELEKHMNYNVENFIDFSKLFLPTRLTGYSDFNSGCDIESLLELVNQISEFPREIREMAEELINKVLKPYKSKHSLDVNEYEAAIGTIKRFIKCLDWDREADLDIYAKYGIFVIDQQFIDDMHLSSGSGHSFEEATHNFIVKCQSLQEGADGHSGQLDNLSDLGEPVATRSTAIQYSMPRERIVKIELNEMKQEVTTAISCNDQDLEPEVNDDEPESEVTKSCSNLTCSKEKEIIYPTNIGFNDSKRTHNLSDLEEPVATRSTRIQSSMPHERIVNIALNRMKQVDKTAISCNDQDLEPEVNDDELESEVTKSYLTCSKEKENMYATSSVLNDSKRTAQKMTVVIDLKKIGKNPELFKDNDEEKSGKMYTTDGGFQSSSSTESDTSVFRPTTKIVKFMSPGTVLLEDDDKMKEEIENDIATLLGSFSGKLEENMKRWLVIGICINSVLPHVLRKYISMRFQQVYIMLNNSHSLDKQQHPDILNRFNGRNIDYRSINGNSQKSSRLEYTWDFRVLNAVDLSKLMLPSHMAFDSDDSVSLTLALNILQFIEFSKNEQAIKKVMDITNLWAHGGFGKWDDRMYSLSFENMEGFIKSLNLQSEMEQSTLDKLNLWKRNGQLFVSHSLDLEFVTEVKEQAQVFSKSASNLADEISCGVDGVQDVIMRFDKVMDTVKYEVPEILKAVVKKWVDADEQYIPTQFGNQIKTLLQRHQCVTVTGPPGCGKSFTARHIALQLRNNFNIVPIYDPRDLHKYYHKDEKTIFILDDICGKYYIDDQLTREWQKQIDVVNAIKSNCDRKIIVCCRLQIFRDEMFRAIFPFMSCVCNMRDFPLTIAEMSGILEKYTQQRLKNWQLEWINSCTDSVLPLSCSQYMCQNVTSRSISDFFNDSYHVLRHELEILFRGDHSCKILLCGLCVLVLRNNRVDKSWLKGKVTPAQRELLDDLSDALELDDRLSKVNIIQALNILEQTYVKEDVDFYKSINDYMFESLVRYFSERALECIIDHTVPDFIHKQLIWQTKNAYPTQVTIPLESTHIYLQRLVREWSKGNVYRVFNDRNMQIEEVRTMLIDHLNGLDKYKREYLVNRKDVHTMHAGTTPLIQASYLGFFDFAKWLIGNNSHVDLRDKIGRSALKMAFYKKDLKIIDILVKTNANCNVIDRDGNPLLCWAISNGNFDLTKLLIEKGADINSKNKRGDSTLHCGCRYGHTEIIILLLEHEADANIQNMDNLSPLLLACFQNQKVELIKCLLKVSNVNIVDRDGRSPLYWSSYNGNLDAVSLLLSRNDCEVDSKSKDGTTALHIASYRRKEDIISILLEKNANVNLCDLDGATPLYYACLSGFDSPIQIVKLLLNSSIDLNIQVITGETVLALVVMLGHVDIVELLLEAGANCNESIYKKGKLESIKMKKLASLKNKVYILLSKILPNKPKRTDIKSFDEVWDLYTGSSPLHLACLMGHYDITCLLLQKGAVFGAKKEGGEEPLYYACRFGHLDIVKLLVEKGADISATVDGKSLSDVSKDCGYTDIVEFLSNFQKKCSDIKIDIVTTNESSTFDMTNFY